MEYHYTGESDVTRDTDDTSLAAHVLENPIGGSWKNLSAVAAQELHFVLRRLIPHFFYSFIFSDQKF